MKILGGSIIIITCGWLGLTVAQGYRARIEQLRQLNAGLKMLETEIVYTATPLSLALGRVGMQLNGPVAAFFAGVARALMENAGAGAMMAWEKGLEELAGEAALQPQDLEIIKSLGPMLGISGVDDQVKNLELARQLLGQQLVIAQEACHRLGKMWNTLGFLLGITLVLLLY